VLASGIWYTSSTFWTVSGVAVAIIAVAVSVALWRLGPSRRLLTYSVLATVPLLNKEAPDLPESDVRVIVRRHTLRRPYVTSVHIESRSRRDIRSVDFDQNRPLTFDVGVPVFELLSREDLHKNSPHINLGIEGSKVTIEPTLIRRRQVIRLDLLTDGRPSVTCNSSLVDVTVRQQRPDYVEPTTWLRWLGRAWLIFFVPGIALITIENHHHPAAAELGRLFVGYWVVLLFVATIGYLWQRSART
jgi:hypothetical protein